MLLYFKWASFIHQWTDRIESFKNEVRVNIDDNDSTLRGLAMILTILVHDAIYKVLVIFFFSRYKPPSLNFTVTQLIGPVVDILIVALSFLTIIKQLLTIVIKQTDEQARWKYFMFTPLFNAAMPFCLKKREQQILRYRKRQYGDELTKQRSVKQLITLLVVLIFIPLVYMAFKFLACWCEFMIALATYANSIETLQSRQLQDEANRVSEETMAAQTKLKLVSSMQSTLMNSYDDAMNRATTQVNYYLSLFPLEMFKSRTCVNPKVLTKGGLLAVNYQPSPLLVQSNYYI